jgi:hypothetical protein
MAKAQDTSITTIDDAPKTIEPVAVAQLQVNNDGDVLSGERVELTIHQGEGDSGRDPVFIGLNGTGYQVPRDTPVEVPVELLQILENAVQIVYEANGNTSRARQVKRFSYNARPAAKAA